MSRQKRVLLVDDDPDIVESTRLVFEAAGYEVMTGVNGEECCAKAKACAPDLIVLDIMMASQGDGMFAAQELRKDESTKDIPIIVVTGVNEMPRVNMGPDAGWLPVDVFIEKPVAPHVLLEEVKRVLGEPRTVILRSAG